VVLADDSAGARQRRRWRSARCAALAPLAFVVANLVLLFSGFAVVWKLFVAILIGFVLLAISAATSRPGSTGAPGYGCGRT
jgi:hypothetical protein